MTSRFTPAMVVARRQQERREAKTGPLTRPVSAQIYQVDPQTETITFLTGALGPQPSSVSFPYLGNNSWIRAMPEVGSSGMTTMRGDFQFQNWITYFRDNMAQDRITATNNGDDIYRLLNPGEFDIMSTGVAYIHGSQRGTLELRGGCVHARFSQDLKEIRHRAPTLRLEFQGFQYSQNINNMRLGVVKRVPPQSSGGGSTSNPSGSSTGGIGSTTSSSGETGASSSSTAPQLEIPVQIDNNGSQTYAKEASVIITAKNGSPQLLADVRLGHVIDDDGTEPLQGDTSNKLRYRAILGTNNNTDVLKMEVDIKGNTKLLLPQTAEEGYILDTINGKAKLQSAKEFKIITQDKFTVNASGNAKIHSDAAITLDSSDIRLGSDNVTEPGILGNQLVNLLTELINGLQSGAVSGSSCSFPGLLPLLTTLNNILAQRVKLQ